MKPRERILARLSLGDEPIVMAGIGQDELDTEGVGARDSALVRLGALLALDAPTSSLHRVVTEAHLAGVSEDDIVQCLVALVPTLGSARASAVAPHLAMAMGFDLDQALEER
jgi:hypothetical protein